MASFRQRGTRWNVQIIRKNNPRVSKTFSTKEAAKCWARKIERDIDLKGFKKTEDLLSKNYNLIPLEVSEITKVDAGLSCMSIRW